MIYDSKNNESISENCKIYPRNPYGSSKIAVERLLEDLYYNGIQLELGYLYWQVQNLHVYERHFDLVK